MGPLSLAAMALAYAPGCAPPEERYAIERTEQALERLTREVVRLHPGASILVLGNPFTQIPGASAKIREAEAAAVRGIERGMDNDRSRVSVDYPQLKPGAMENPQSFLIPHGATTPLSFLWAPTALEDLRRKHPEAMIWISLIGLPVDVAASDGWRESSGPRWALYLPDFAVLGSPEAIREAFETGRIAAAVVPRAGAPKEAEPVGGDSDADSNRRFQIITRENIGEALGSNSPGAVP
jgi:hypothetical protein